MVENGHQNVYGRRPRYPTGLLDICSIARGLGATTARIDSTGRLDPAILDAPGPVVIEVRIDADIVIPKVDRVAVMATAKAQPPPLAEPAAPPQPPGPPPDPRPARLRVVN
jgi:acetolactate synthase-1/2/3 large subunit